MTALTAAGMVDEPKDGSGDTVFEAELGSNVWHGRLEFKRFILWMGILGFVLSSVFYLIARVCLGEIAEPLRYWIVVPILSVILTGVGIFIAITVYGWKIPLIVRENHSLIVIDVFPGRLNKQIKLPGGSYFIPPWWLIKPENLTNHEDVTIPLPNHDYAAKGAEGGATVGGSITICVPFNKAHGFISRDKSVINTLLVDAIKGRIAPIIAKYDVKHLSEKPTEVTREITDSFLGARTDEVEDMCHVSVKMVTISEVTLNHESKQEFQKNVAAKAQKDRMEYLRSVIQEGGKIIDDPVKRFDAMKLAGIDPGRTLTDDKKVMRHEADENMVKVAEGLGSGFAQGLAMLAKIMGGVQAIKGEEPAEPGKPKKT